MILQVLIILQRRLGLLLSVPRRRVPVVGVGRLGRLQRHLRPRLQDAEAEDRGRHQRQGGRMQRRDGGRLPALQPRLVLRSVTSLCRSLAAAAVVCISSIAEQNAICHERLDLVLAESYYSRDFPRPWIPLSLFNVSQYFPSRSLDPR